jgi:hypothetical protein
VEGVEDALGHLDDRSGVGGVLEEDGELVTAKASRGVPRAEATAQAVGDRALKVIADRIRTIIRPGDTAGRLGGDEFAVLLEDIDSPDVVLTVSNRLLEGIIQPIELDDAAPIVSASIGSASCIWITHGVRDFAYAKWLAPAVLPNGSNWQFRFFKEA